MGIRINGVWSSDYVDILGVFDHCHEIIALIDHKRIVKAKSKSRPMFMDERAAFSSKLKAIDETIDSEMLDLYIIINQWIKNDDSGKRVELLEARAQKFRDKSLAEDMKNGD